MSNSSLVFLAWVQAHGQSADSWGTIMKNGDQNAQKLQVQEKGKTIWRKETKLMSDS